MAKYKSRYSGPQIDAGIEKSHKTGTTDPTVNTVGVLGQRYFNTATGDTFECVDIETVDDVTTFTWRSLSIELASTAAGKGASLIGVQDEAGLFTAAQVEAILAEIAGAGRTTESLKGLGTLISTHMADLITDADGAHGLKVETGVFDLNVIGTTTAGTATYTNRYGSYTKIGNLINIRAYVGWSAHTGTGNLRLTGLPVANANVGFNYTPVAIRNEAVTTPANTFLQGYIIPGGTSIELESCTVASAIVNNVAMDTAGAFMINATYKIS